MVVEGHDLALYPASKQGSGVVDIMLDWGYRSRHFPLMSVVSNHGGLLRQSWAILVQRASKEGDSKMLDFLLRGEVSSAAKQNALGAAAEGGHLDDGSQAAFWD